MTTGASAGHHKETVCVGFQVELKGVQPMLGLTVDSGRWLCVCVRVWVCVGRIWLCIDVCGGAWLCAVVH